MVEVHLSGMGDLTVNPEVEEAESLPHQSSGTMDVGDLKVGMVNITVEGRVVEEPVLKRVETKKDGELTVASLRLGDETGEVRASLWRDLAHRA